MKPEFHDDYIADNRDPLAPPMEVDFDWNELYERFGEPSDRQIHDEQREEMNEFVRNLFEWGAAVDTKNPNALTMLAKRFLAAMWVTNPAYFEGSPSASKIAEMFGIKRKADFWTLTGEVSRRFGITNRGQSHAWNRGKASPRKSTMAKTDPAPGTTDN